MVLALGYWVGSPMFVALSGGYVPFDVLLGDGEAKLCWTATMSLRCLSDVVGTDAKGVLWIGQIFFKLI